MRRFPLNPHWGRSSKCECLRLIKKADAGLVRVCFVAAIAPAFVPVERQGRRYLCTQSALDHHENQISTYSIYDELLFMMANMQVS